MSHYPVLTCVTVRYTFTIVKRNACAFLVIFFALNFAHGEETSFRGVKLPNLKGKQVKAVLTFSDTDKAIEVRPVKGEPVRVPYGQIDKCAYEYTDALSVVLTPKKDHWLRIDYHDQDAHKLLVVRLDRHNYIRVLDALKAHTGIDAELQGNARKR